MRTFILLLLSTTLGGILAASAPPQVMPPLCGCTKTIDTWPLVATPGAHGGAQTTTTCSSYYDSTRQVWLCTIWGTIYYIADPAPVVTALVGTWSPGPDPQWGGPQGHFNPLADSQLGEYTMAACTTIGGLNSWITISYVINMQWVSEGAIVTWDCETQ